VVVVIGALLMGPPAEPSPDGDSAAPGGDSAAAPIRIGVIAPLSGALAPYGKGTLSGMELRVAEINAAGGINGAPLKLYVEDNKGDATESLNAYRKLVGSDQVIGVLGPVTSTCTLAIRREARKLEVPVITPTGTNDDITPDNPWMFRSCFRDSFQGRVMANYLFTDQGLKRAAIFTDMNSDYSKGLSASFKDAFIAAGGEVVAEEGYRQKDLEFGSQLKQMIEGGAELIYVPGYPPEVPMIIKQARVIGFEGPICGADGWDKPEVITGSGEAIAGCVITGMFAAADQRPVVQQFVQTVREQLDAKPDTFNAQGYDTVSLVARALDGSDQATSTAVRDGLLAIDGFEAVTGEITISPEGDALKSAVIFRIEKGDDGEFTKVYQATVNP
jgi:branched-chain amino acid transport system substrate-binding protein